MFDLKCMCECGREFLVEQNMVRTFKFEGGDVQQEDEALYVTAYWCPECDRFILAQLDNSATKRWLSEVKQRMASLSKLKARGYEGKKIERNKSNAKWLSERMSAERARLLEVYAGIDVMIEGKSYRIPSKAGAVSTSDVPVAGNAEESVQQ